MQKQRWEESWKGKKVAKPCVLPMFCGSGRSKSRLAKAAGAEPSSQMRDEKIAPRYGAKQLSKSKCLKSLMPGASLEVEMSKRCTLLRREARFQVTSVKNWRAVSGRFGNWDVAQVHAVVVRSTCPSQNAKDSILEARLDVEILTKCTPLRSEAHVEVKSVKDWRSRGTFWG